MGEIALGIITVSNYNFNINSPLNYEFVKAYNEEFTAIRTSIRSAAIARGSSTRL